GRLAVLDSQKKQVIITLDNQSISITIDRIERGEFGFKNNGAPRGPGIPIKGQRRKRLNIPFSKLNNREGNRGQAEVSLPAGVDPQIGKDREAIYVIEALTFLVANQVTIEVIVAS